MIEYYRKEVPMQNQAFMKVDISSILGQINENITFCHRDRDRPSQFSLRVQSVRCPLLPPSLEKEWLHLY